MGMAMEKRTIVRRVEVGADDGSVHIVLAKQLAEPCLVTKTDADGTPITEPGERLLVDEPHRLTLYPWRDNVPAEKQVPFEQQIADANSSLALSGFPPIPADGVDRIKRLIAAL